jgi:hypothetical protein
MTGWQTDFNINHLPQFILILKLKSIYIDVIQYNAKKGKRLECIASLKSELLTAYMTYIYHHRCYISSRDIFVRYHVQNGSASQPASHTATYRIEGNFLG